MIVCRTKDETRAGVAQARAGGASVGLVPTMGALHEGHLSLVRRAVADNDITVVSIFVNPTQFAPGGDLDRYPRPFEADTVKCEVEGVDIVFAPSPDEMYAEDASTYVEETSLSRGLCGRSRPGHFRGVTTVVTKLLNIVQPDRAYFGRKDAQQAAVIGRMVRDLDIRVDIVVMPIVREADGLALSSRNAYLSPGERREALVLSRALEEAERLFAAGEKNAAALKKAMIDIIAQAPHSKVDYVEIVDARNLEEVEEITRPATAALAVFIGRTRLIDNGLLQP
ncbi:MAG: pantoate--beta-alanine ligase [Planctomycetes bacterium]|nr:pantoate--beta-alanine ligase [Planctomycetota bacterium]